MKYGLNILLTSMVSMQVLLGTFHLSFHSHSHIDNHSICNVGCENEGHHATVELCDLCLNQQSQLSNLRYQGYSSKVNQTHFFNYNSYYKQVTLPF